MLFGLVTYVGKAEVFCTAHVVHLDVGVVQRAIVQDLVNIGGVFIRIEGRRVACLTHLSREGEEMSVRVHHLRPAVAVPDLHVKRLVREVLVARLVTHEEIF